MFKKSGRLLSVILCFCMLASSLFIPLNVMAETGNDGLIATMGSNPFYSIGQEVGVMVQDADLASAPPATISVRVTSTTDTTGVAITLNLEGEPGRYTGKVLLSDSASNEGSNPPVIQCVNGDDVSFYYEDADNTGGSAINRDTHIKVADRVAAPQTDIASGTVTTDTEVTLITGTSDAAIYYTIDGSTPTRGSIQFSSGILVSANQYLMIKAFAVKNEMADSDISTFEYNKSGSFTGIIKESSGSVIVGGGIDVERNTGDNHYSYLRYMDAPDGSFTISDFEDGEYRIRANPPFESDNAYSDWFGFKVTGGNYTTLDNEGITDVTLTAKGLQLRGAVSGTTGAALAHDDYDIRIRPSNPQGGNYIPYDCNNGNGSYKVSGLSPGDYYIWMDPRDNSPYAGSSAFSIEKMFSIDSNGVASPPVLDLQLTEPQLTGTVKGPGGTTVITSGNVDILNSNGDFLQYTMILSDGRFVIGGLNEGDYKIRAIPAGIPEYSGYQPSDAADFSIDETGISSPSSIDLELKEKILRVERVEDATKGDNEIRIRMNNLDLLNNNFGGLRAEVPGRTYYFKNVDNWNDNSATIHFRVDGDNGLDLDFGNHPVQVYNGSELDPVAGSGQYLTVIQYIRPVQPVYSLEDYTTTGIATTFTANNNDYPWDANESLTVNIISESQDHLLESTVTAISDSDKTLAINIPAQPGAQTGWRYAEVYSGTQLKARGNFQIGTARIDGAYTINQGDNWISIHGDCLIAYENPKIVAEVWKDGMRLAESQNNQYRDNNLEFEFPVGFDVPGDTYSVKVFDTINGRTEISTPGGLSLKVAPLLLSTPHTINGNNVTIYSSSLDAFKWSASDDITKFNINVHGDWFGWDVDSHNGGLSFDGDGNLVVSPLSGRDGSKSFPDYATSGRMEIDRDGEHLGFAEFTIGDAFISGIVKEPSGTGIVPGGRILIRKQEDWDDSSRMVNVGIDGRFYISKNEIPHEHSDINGKYTLTAIPTEDTIYASSRPFTFVIVNEELSGPNDITVQLENTQIAGTVLNIYSGLPVNVGNVDVFDNSSERRWLTSANVFSNGTFRIGGLDTGSYWLKAYPSDGLWMMSSDMQQVTVTAGVANTVLTLNAPQITGEVKDADGNALRGDQYYVHVRPINGDNWNAEWRSNDGYYVAGNLTPGRYGIRIAPNGDSSFTQSFESEFIVTSGTTETAIVPLELTRPQFAGSVVAPDGTTLVTSGNVDIFDSNENYLTNANIRSDDGTYKIGGLDDGEYYISANPDRNNPEYNEYDSSDKVRVEILDGKCTSPDENGRILVLRQKAARLKFVDNLVKWDGSFTARITNASRTNDWDWSKVRAEIKSGSTVLLNISHCYEEHRDGQSDECVVRMDQFDDKSLAFGKYTLKLYYDEQELPVEENCEFSVISGAYTDPAVVVPEQYNGKAMWLDVGSDPREYPWSEDDQLTVRITSEQDNSVVTTTSAIINEDNTLSFHLPSLPDEKILEGRQFVDVLRNYGTLEEQLLAVCSFSVGVSHIEKVKVREGISELIIAGSYLDYFMNSPCIEIYQDGSLITRSGDWYNSWGNMLFHLPVNLSTGENYTVKLYSRIEGTMREAVLPNSGVFRVVPRLDGDDTVITGQAPGETITINESGIAGYQWSAGQDIQGSVSNPDRRFIGHVTKTNGLVVNENSLVFTTTENIFEQDTLWEGIYTIDLFDDTGMPLGYAQFIVDDTAAVLKGTVIGTDGQPSGGGSIHINKENDDWGRMIPVGQNGKFYFRADEMERGDGDYTFTANPPATSPDSQGRITIQFSEGTFQFNDVQTHNIVIELNETQIKGHVNEGSSPARGGMVYLDLNSGDNAHYEVPVDLNGDYKIGGLVPGSYNIKARASDTSDYLVSDNQEIALGAMTEGSTPIIRYLDLKLPQLTGSALDIGSNPLRGDRYSLRLRNLDPDSDGNAYYDDKREDGQYSIGGLREGKYGISLEPGFPNAGKSFEQVFTVDKNGNASPATIDLKLANIELTGTVYTSSAKTAIFNEGYVDVFDGSWNSQQYLTTATLDENGKFSIGGLPSGRYWIRAALHDRWKYPELSASKTVEVQISEAGEPTTKDLFLCDTAPRIKWINDTDPWSEKVQIRLANIESNESYSGIDFRKMKAEILNASGSPLNPPIVIEGEQNFWKDGNYDQWKNEGDISIFLGNTRLMPDKYKLKLTYNGIVVENEAAAGVFDGFMSCYHLNINPFDIRPEATGSRTLDVGLDMDMSEYPWDQEDTLVIRMTKPDKSQINLPCEIAPDKSVSTALPAGNLPEGSYQMELYKGDSATGVLIARSQLTVGYPEITDIYDMNEDDNGITLDGSKLLTYLDKPTKVKVFNSENNLVAQSTNVQFMWGRLVYDFGDTTLIPGTYTLNMTYDGNPVTLPEDGQFNVVNKLTANPSYVIANTASTVVTFTLRNGGSAPWSLSDTLLVEINHQDGSGNLVTVPDTVTATTIGITLPTLHNEDRIHVNIYKVDGAGVRKYIAYSSFDVAQNTQVTGVVKDPSGNPIPGANVVVCIDNENEDYVADFNTDDSGKYAIYGIEPGRYIIFAKPPKGEMMRPSEKAYIEIDGSGAAVPSVQDLQLKAARKISGRVSLPDGETVSDGAIKVWIAAWNDNDTPDNNDDDSGYGTQLVIDEGSEGVDYTILVPVDNTRYRLQLWSTNTGYIDGGVYYNTSGTVLTVKDATVFSVEGADKSGMDITLVKGNAISGTISLPSGITANKDGVRANIYIEKDFGTADPYDDLTFENQVFIEPGQYSAEYKVVVPAASGYIFRYDLDTSMNNLLRTGYYKSGLVSAYKPQDATLIDAVTNKPGMNIALLKALTITGTVTLPSGTAVPSEGMDMWIGAVADQGTEDNGDDFSAGDNIHFSEGQTSAEYTISVPDAAETYWLRLYGGSKVGCTEGVFYGSTGISHNIAGAYKFGMSGANRTGMNFNLVKGRMIRGTLVLPEGKVAPAGGIEFIVWAIRDNNNNDYTDDISTGWGEVIAANTTSGAFEMIVPAMSGFRLQYNIDPSYGFMGEGYYTTGGTTLDPANAELLDMTAGDKTNLVFEMVSAKYISGTIALPSGVTAPDGGADLWIDLGDEKVISDPDDDFWTGASIHFDGNATSAAFKIAVPESNTGYVVQVLDGGKIGCVDTMFYTTSGSAFLLNDAAKVDVSSGDASGINIILEKGHPISGMVTLPQGVTAPAGGIDITIAGIVGSSDGDYRKEVQILSKVDIAAGATSAAYSIHVPDRSDIRVMYGVYSPDFERRGYYKTSTETTLNYDEAALLDAAATGSIEGIDLHLLNKADPACINAVVVATGTAIRLDFSKPLARNTTAAGFTVTVGSEAYEISGAALSTGKTSLTLQLKDYFIYKDYKDIQVAYSDTAGIKTYDGVVLPSFTASVTNSSIRAFSASGIANNALVNRNVVLTVNSTDDVITITSVKNTEAAVVTTESGTNTITFDSTGVYSVTIAASGRKSGTSLSFEIDKIRPEIEILNVPDVVENNHDGIIPAITFSGDVASMRVVTLNGQVYDGSLIKGAGYYVLTASAKDAAGNIATASKAFEIKWDTSAPVISVNIANGEILGSDPTLNISLAGGSNAANYTYTAALKKPNGSIVSFTSANVPAITEEGVYRLEIKALNPSYSDITSSKIVEFTLDKSAPAVSISNVTNSNGNNFNTSVTPAITLTDTVASQQLLTSNATITLTRNSSPVAYKPGDTLSIDGSYVLTASTVDGFDRASNTASASFTIDRTKPVITIAGALDGYTYKDQNVMVSAVSVDGTLSVKCNGSSLALTDDKYTFTGTAGEIETYKLVFTSTDTAGNTTEQKLSFTIDRLPVNIVVDGIAEGQTVNYSKDISFSVYEGDTAVTGATATIDGVNFAGGMYGAEGSHTLVVKYISGSNTYLKTVHFTIDKTKPALSITGIAKNGSNATGAIYAKAGDTIKVTANVSDLHGVGGVTFSVGTVALKIPMKNTSGSVYEGEFKVESGNYANQSISVNAADIAGNTSSAAGPNVSIFNTKPVVSLATAPAGPDGNNGIFRSTTMNLTLNASATDIIYYYFNGASANAVGTKALTPVQGTNTLVYFAIDVAGNKSDEKAFVFEYDSVRPSNVIVSPALNTLDNKQLITITGSVPGEGGKTGSRVLLKKAAEVIAQAVITSSGTFSLDGIRLTEGNNSFELISKDTAGNESAAATTVTTKLDSTAPVVKVEKAERDDVTYHVEVMDESVSPAAIKVKFNGADIAADQIIDNGAISGGERYTVTVPGQMEGSNTLNVLVADRAGNAGAGSFTSTYIPPNEEQLNVPVNDNATMDIPGDAFEGTTSVQMLVRTVNVQGAEEYKPLCAPISFEFTQDGVKIEPASELIIRNFIGTGLTGVMLMHITSGGTIEAPISAEETTSGAFEESTMETFESGHAYYLSDTGYLIFKTKSFSTYQIVQDNTPPVIAVTTADFDINKADALTGKKAIAGTLDDSTARVTEVTIDGTAITLSGTTGAAFNIPLTLTDGTHEVVLKASDTIGNTSSVTRIYRVDTTAPTLSVTASVTQTKRNTADINITVDENSEIKMNGSSKGYFNGSNVIAYALGQGANTIEVTATDAFGNTTIAPVITIDMDSIAPEISITGISDGDVYGGPKTITVDVTDPHLSQTTIKMDGTPYTPATYSTEGRHTLTVDAADTFGNSASQSITFTIDTSVPTISASGTTNGIFNTDKTIVITASNADELKVTRSTDGQPAQNVTVSTLSATVDLDAAANMAHTYVVKATATKIVDGQVRSASSTYSVTIDKKAPVITSTTSTVTESSTINIIGTVDETVDLYLDNILKNQDLPAGTFTFSGVALEIGDNTFTVKAVDAAGNEATRDITIRRNTPAPVIDPGTDGPGGGSTPVGGGAVGGAAPAPATTGGAILAPLGRKNSGELKPVDEPNPGTAVDSAESKAIGTSGGTVSTSGGAFGLKIPAGAVSGSGHTFRLVVFEIDPKSPLAQEEQIKAGTIKLVSKVVDFGTTADKLLKPVIATFHYDRQAVTNAQNLRVFYWNVRTNAWVPVASANTRVNAAEGFVEADLQHFTRYAVMEVKSTLKFADVQKQWYSTYVDRISMMGITTGIIEKGTRVYKPDATLTRAEFVTMLGRMLKISAPNQSLSAFKDASSIPSYAAGYIKAAYAKGIISPYEDGTFKPNQAITREEMAVMLIKAMGLKPSGDASSFKDQLDITASARAYVAKAAEKGILLGEPDGKFYPTDSLTRGQAAKVIIEMVEVLGTL